ncbi:hypothetical protein EC991_001143 [Linnemannia zychae]|nr:hypothetical protein EC991_001143 [Linnemannia zychae]
MSVLQLVPSKMDMHRMKRSQNYEDCVVYGINNIDALAYIRDWANKAISISHDPNVRFNAALASQRYDTATGTIVDVPGEFSLRRFLPEAPFVDYQIKCLYQSPVLLREEWVVSPRTQVKFEDAASFVENICRAEGRAQPTPSPRYTSPGPSPSPTPSRRRPPRTTAAHKSSHIYTPQWKRQIPTEPSPGPVPAPAPSPSPTPEQEAQPVPIPSSPDLTSAEKIMEGNATVFYQSLLKPSMGIMVVHSFSPAVVTSEIELILRGLQALHARNATQLLIDLQNSDGENFEFATQLVQMVFTNVTSTQLELGAGARTGRFVRQLSQGVYGRKDESKRVPFDAHMFIDLDVTDNDREPYKDNSLFENSIDLTRFGRTATYTHPTTLSVNSLSPNISAVLTQFPWTNNPARIRLISNGLCLSACGMAMHLWTALYKIRSYGFGGSPVEPLSMFSAAGGMETSLEEIQQLYTEIGVPSPMQDLGYQSDVRLSWVELYSWADGGVGVGVGVGERKLLDYDAAVHSALYQTDLLPELARDRGMLWLTVGNTAW